MKAAMVEKPGALSIRDVPEPEPGEYEVLCEMLYGATCTGTDQHIIHGRMPWTIEYPVILGHESVGRVIRVGPNVRYFKTGHMITRVGAPAAPDGAYGISWGGFAELGIARDHRAMREDGLPEERWTGYRVNQIVPPEIDPRAATMIITWRETLSYITRMGVGDRASVLVIGSGGNGLAFVAHARNMGASRIAMLGSPAREEAAREAGAGSYFDYHVENPDKVIKEIHAEGFDFIIDAVGRQGQVDQVFPLLENRGTLGIYGIDDFNTATINPRRATGTFTYYNEDYDEEETHDRVIAYMRDGALDARIWLDLERPYPLTDIVSAFDAVQARKAVKALVRLSPEKTG